jgi:metal-dependent hydrolase (beta-lactamase superfamily II)
MEVKVLVDNRRKDENLKIEHGLSLYIETENH